MEEIVDAAPAIIEQQPKVATIEQQPKVEEEDEVLEETILERIQGLGEMFPEGLRDFTCSTAKSSKGFLKGAYYYTRQGAFFLSTTCLLLLAPVILDLEIVNTIEHLKQDKNKLMLGPGMAMAGGAPA